MKTEEQENTDKMIQEILDELGPEIDERVEEIVETVDFNRVLDDLKEKEQ